MLAFNRDFDHINSTFQRFEAGLPLPVSTFMLFKQLTCQYPINESADITPADHFR